MTDSSVPVRAEREAMKSLLCLEEVDLLGTCSANALVVSLSRRDDGRTNCILLSAPEGGMAEVSCTR